MEVKFCKDCKWSEPELNSEWNLCCFHPEVNAGDNYALASSKLTGTCCRDERNKGRGVMRWYGVCGMRGAKWEQR